ncbi:1447_t:CDS:2 [Funneliformis caledonium]|uniref:E3 ubiquitin-protein ligase n=1 Tax=Funneliformis caledonium TaxID=1117310 RepID=A0A9N9DSV4_9GLOM|nr:1447_t:CDS:2 [Funneliformis caledonium]
MATNMWDEVIVIKFMEALDARAYHVISDNPFDEKNTENLMRALDESRTFLLNFRKQCIGDFLNSFKLDEISSKFKELDEALIQAQTEILPYMDAVKDLKPNPGNHNQKPKPQLPTSNPTELSPQSRTCHDNLVLGEKYYICKTCATRDDSVLCYRCYNGTNHIGHDIIYTIMNSNEIVKCNCDNINYWKFQLNCKYHPSDTQIGGPSYCGKKIAVGEVYYHCSTCFIRSDNVICDRCFAGSNHVGHDVSKIENSWPSAWCDCGDYSINCKYHPPTGTI